MTVLRRRRDRYLLASVAIAATFFTLSSGACSSDEGALGPAYVDITPQELAQMLENKDFVLINTHIPYEGEIAQTDLFLPYDQAAQQLDELPADKDAKIVAYCRTDRMSRISLEEWAKAGYTNLYNLAGGFVAWEAAGYELLHK